MEGTRESREVYEFWLRNECPICHTQFETKSERNHHMTAHGKFTRPGISCAECPEQRLVFSSHHAWRCHQSTVHEGRLLFPCTEPSCSKNFTSRNGMRTHAKQQHHKPPTIHACNFCTKTYPTVSGLYQHNRLKHVTSTSHICSVCNRSHVSRTALVAHLRYFHKPLRYTCPNCTDSFFNARALRLHQAHCPINNPVLNHLRSLLPSPFPQITPFDFSY
jgi:hypothetical protein